MHVGIATDHGGFSLKEEVVAQLRAAGHEVVNFGTHEPDAGRRLSRLRRPPGPGGGGGQGRARRGDLRQRRGRPRSVPTRSRASVRRSSTTTFPPGKGSRTIT